MKLSKNYKSVTKLYALEHLIPRLVKLFDWNFIISSIFWYCGIWIQLRHLILEKLLEILSKKNSKGVIISIMSVFQSDVILYITSDGGCKMVINIKIIHFETEK